MSPLVRRALTQRAHESNVLPVDTGADFATRRHSRYAAEQSRRGARGGFDLVAERDAIAADPVDSLKAEAGAW